ncbi:MAG: allantoinase AllB [Myxococcaceae bacterium]|jgi:allantoinase|nr:allantoinase AllB [Myxococcaceae bacterium]MCA3011432.1 allantoinase AllB [Myxococcaceae bacterium]
MPHPTLLIRGQRVLLPTGLAPATLHVCGERITEVTPLDAPAPADVPVVDAGRLLVTPGLVDSHVHINEPGRTEWEGFRTATEAAAAGGITTVVDMPLNSIPPTTSADAAKAKQDALGDQLHVNVAFWGGVVPGNRGELDGLSRFGVPGCKCFTCHSGADEFPMSTRDDLDAAMPVLRDAGQVLLVHAEAMGPLERAEAELAAEQADPRKYQTYLRSRPNAAEDEAIAMVIELAAKHRCPAHIVHLSSASALPLLERAQAEGVPVTAETCLHYLAFTAEEIPDGATHFKCAPPIREASNRERLWQGLERGIISQVVSDHSPCTPALKKPETGDFLGAWGGIAGLQLGLSVLWTLARQRGSGLDQVVRWNTLAPARLAGLQARKGQLAAGFDADVVLWDDEASFTVEPAGIRHRHKVTPYAGRTLFGVVHETYVRGRRAYSRRDGLSRPGGRFEAVGPAQR